MIKAIIFDADDTLYATGEAAKKAEILSMDFFARQKNLNKEELYKEFLQIVEKIKKSSDPLHRHRRYSYAILAKKHGLENVEEAYRIFFDEVIRQIKIMPGLHYAMQKLSPYKKAVVSQDFKEQIKRKLKNFKLNRYFNAVITCDDVKVMKPNKKYYLTAFKRLKVRPEECIAIGDDYERDLRIPKSLGCTTIIYGSNSNADYCFSDYRKLPALVAEISKTESLIKS